MSIHHKTTFLSKVRAALGHDPNMSRSSHLVFKSSGFPVNSIDEPLLQNPLDFQVQPDKTVTISRSTQEKELLISMLKTAAIPLRLQVEILNRSNAAAMLQQSILKLVSENQPEWGNQKILVVEDHPLIHQIDLKKFEKLPDVQVFTSAPVEHPKGIKDALQHAMIGITTADFCVAETGTIVMINRLKSLSLLPSIHVVILYDSQIVANFKELYYLLYRTIFHSNNLSPHMVFITGPSKTADIEAVMVHGAHGPRQMIIYIISC